LGLGSSWACMYFRGMTGVAVISLPIRGAWSRMPKERKKIWVQSRWQNRNRSNGMPQVKSGSKVGGKIGTGAMGCRRSHTKMAVAGKPRASSEIGRVAAVGCCSSREQMAGAGAPGQRDRWTT
jgi:hypothetical protein